MCSPKVRSKQSSGSIAISHPPSWAAKSPVSTQSTKEDDLLNASSRTFNPSMEAPEEPPATSLANLRTPWSKDAGAPGGDAASPSAARPEAPSGQAADVRRLCQETSEVVGTLARALQGISQEVAEIRSDHRCMQSLLTHSLGQTLDQTQNGSLSGSISTTAPSRPSFPRSPGSPCAERAPSFSEDGSVAITPTTPAQDQSDPSTRTRSAFEVKGRRSPASSAERSKSGKLSKARDAWRRSREDAGVEKSAGPPGSRASHSPGLAEAKRRVQSMAAVEALLQDVRTATQEVRNVTQALPEGRRTPNSVSVPISVGPPTSPSLRKPRHDVSSPKAMGKAVDRPAELPQRSDWSGRGGSVSLPCRSNRGASQECGLARTKEPCS